MPYREQLAERLRIALCEYGGIEERKMFGALGMTKRGNMPGRAMQQAVMFCVRANQIETALARAYQLNDPVRTGVLRKKKAPATAPCSTFSAVELRLTPVVC